MMNKTNFSLDRVLIIEIRYCYYLINKCISHISKLQVIKDDTGL